MSVLVSPKNRIDPCTVLYKHQCPYGKHLSLINSILGVQLCLRRQPTAEPCRAHYAFRLQRVPCFPGFICSGASDIHRSGHTHVHFRRRYQPKYPPRRSCYHCGGFTLLRMVFLRANRVEPGPPSRNDGWSFLGHGRRDQVSHA